MFDKFDIICKNCGSKDVDLDIYADVDNMGKHTWDCDIECNNCGEEE